MCNELTLCRGCHTLVHAGLVTVEKNEAGDLLWVPRLWELGEVAPFDPFPQFAEIASHLGELNPLATTRSPDSKSSAADPPEEPRCDLEPLVTGMVRLGYSRSESRQRLEAARERLYSGEVGAVDEAALLGVALRRSA